MGEDSDTVLIGLQGLFELHGAPLVIKSDNGSAFAESRVQALLAEKNVLQLFSPPYYPRYNGSCERGIGWVKARTKYLAELNLRPQAWSSSDLQNAVNIANESIRPWGCRKPTRAEVWNARTPVTDEQRKKLAELRAAKLGQNRTVADVEPVRWTGEKAELRGAAGAPAPHSDQPTTLEAALGARSASDRSEATA
ncbi:hypothetical protein PLCT2_02640 [Planctomycetaceae bacterium]|nr:hypothetical protein PLCT2_02640 [Planctomycetaceae bacterium]